MTTTIQIESGATKEILVSGFMPNLVRWSMEERSPSRNWQLRNSGSLLKTKQCQEQLWNPKENITFNCCQNLEGIQTNVPTRDPDVDNLWPVSDRV